MPPLALKVCEIVSILAAALVVGVFWGPWVALTRSMPELEAKVFLAVVHRMSRNLAPLMTVLMPVALLSIVPVLFLSYDSEPHAFFLNLAGLGLFVIALLVTLMIEVPIVKRIETWTVATLPPEWQELRDRWGAFHIVRIACALIGLTCLVTGAVL